MAVFPFAMHRPPPAFCPDRRLLAGRGVPRVLIILNPVEVCSNSARVTIRVELRGLRATWGMEPTWARYTSIDRGDGSQYAPLSSLARRSPRYRLQPECAVV